MNDIVSNVPELLDFKGTSYYKYSSTKTTKTVLYIHGLGLNKEFFKKHLDLYGLKSYSWVVPDLLGHGISEKHQSLFSYTMKYQAEQLLQLLVHEKVTDLIVVSHSMGSPIAYYLLDSILSIQEIKNKEEFPINVQMYVSVEGNIDINDAFISRQVESNSWKDFVTKRYTEFITGYKDTDPYYYKKIKMCEPWDLYASSVDLVKVSKEEVTLPLLRKISESIPTKILYGEENKGVFTSETLLEKEFTIEYIPHSGHMMLYDNPEGFWKKIMEYFLECT